MTTSLESPTGGGHPPPVRASHLTVVTVMVLTIATVAPPASAGTDAPRPGMARPAAALVADPAPGTYAGPGFDT